jgi:hypothetical protein
VCDGQVTIPGRKLAYRLYGKKGGPVIDVMLQLPPPVKGNSGADNDVAKGDTPAEHKRILCCDPFDAKKRFVWLAVSVVCVCRSSTCVRVHMQGLHHPHQGGKAAPAVL